MNGKQAKRLRKGALAILNKDGISGGEGKGIYNQAMNCPQWEPFTDDDGIPMQDPDTGEAMMTIKKGPGTITNQWRWRVMYRELKKAFKRGGNSG